MSTIVKLPESREEYTVFALETRNDVPMFKDAEQKLGVYRMHHLFKWIVYTVENFPDLVVLNYSVERTRDNAPVSIFVTIAGIEIGEIYNWEHSFSECLHLLVERKEVVLGERNGNVTKNRA